MQQTRAIPKLSALSTDEVARRFLSGVGAPFIVVDALAGQPAFERWSFDLFKERYGDDVVEIADHIDTPLTRLSVTLGEYLDYVVAPEASSLSRLPGRAALYAYGYQPFSAHPELLDDIHDPYCVENWLSTLDPGLKALLTVLEGSPAGQWIFIGPAGTVSTLHTDYTAAWLAQIRGRKLACLFSPEDADRLYEGRVDPWRADLERFPRFRGATRHVGVLEQGEVLVMPHQWWHHVVALEPSITASFNFVNGGNFGSYLAELVRDLPRLAEVLQAAPHLARHLGAEWACRDRSRCA